MQRWYTAPVRRIIVNADDFGLTSGVNRAIIELHRGQVLISATLMARATATEGAIEIAKSTPSLGVGCHVVLVDGEPVLPVEQLGTLASRRTGRFHSSLATFLRRLLAGMIRPEEIEAEAHAQISTLQSRGVKLTHIDTHKHTHMFPAVLRPVLRAARACGICAVRNPFEPAWSLRATLDAPFARRTQVRVLHMLEPRFRRAVVEEGFSTTDGSIGVLATGSLTARTVASLLKNMPEGTFELVTHPGYNDSDLGRVNTRLRASREIERDALAALQNAGEVELISYVDLSPRPLTHT
ncbi:MAG TPA: ChbG/HpnK family deacetylase [Terracidiphilus sp.]|nr:ChbG/HpnK family deacetylase [Terracidiphilus sp.]